MTDCVWLQYVIDDKDVKQESLAVSPQFHRTLGEAIQSLDWLYNCRLEQKSDDMVIVSFDAIGNKRKYIALLKAEINRPDFSQWARKAAS